jgi:hypothetical protein
VEFQGIALPLERVAGRLDSPVKAVPITKSLKSHKKLRRQCPRGLPTPKDHPTALRISTF